MLYIVFGTISKLGEESRHINFHEANAREIEYTFIKNNYRYQFHSGNTFSKRKKENFSLLRDRTKNDIQHDISKRCGRIITKLGG